MIHSLKIVIAAISLLVFAPAYACLPPPPPPSPPTLPDIEKLPNESSAELGLRLDEAMQAHQAALKKFNQEKKRRDDEKKTHWLNKQAYWWNGSSHVVVATLREVRSKDNNSGPDSGEVKMTAKFTPKTRLKGKSAKKQIKIKGSILFLCGVSSSYGLHQAKPGDKYLIFSTEKNLAKTTSNMSSN